MMLGDTQQKTLEYLKQYGCLREDQIEKLLKSQFSYVDMQSVKKQLGYYGMIDDIGGFIALPEKQPETEIISAIDVMLEFPLSDIQLHMAAPEPFNLTFFKNNKDGKLCRYDVCHCKPGIERVLSAQLESLNEKYRTVLIMLDNVNQQKNIMISPDHCFVVREDGQIKFYKPKGANS